MKLMRWRRILLAGFAVISLTSCTSTTMVRPPKPTLTVIERPDGGICLDRHNTVLLGNYIQALESGYP